MVGLLVGKIMIKSKFNALLNKQNVYEDLFDEDKSSFDAKNLTSIKTSLLYNLFKNTQDQYQYPYIKTHKLHLFFSPFLKVW